MPRKKKPARPLTISIHGDGIDIDAKIAHGQLGDTLAGAIKRMNTSTPAVAPITEMPSTISSEALADIMRTLDTDTLERAIEIARREIEGRTNAKPADVG